MVVFGKEERQTLIKENQRHETDTGSAEVQIALLTQRNNHLGEHLKTHKKDYSSRRGLLMMVAHRSSLLRYLARENRARYLELIRRLGIRK